MRNRMMKGAGAGLRAAVFAGLLIAFIAGAVYPEDRPSGDRPRLLVLGFDGMDPRIAEELMKEGKLPNLERLRQRVSFSSLETSIPPQSPVALSNFITWKNPVVHVIFDFIARDPETYLPYLSTTDTVDAAKTVKIFNYIIPLS